MNEPRIIMVLKDGRFLDLTGLSPEAAVEKAKSMGITTDMIERTIHYLPRARPRKKEPTNDDAA